MCSRDSGEVAGEVAAPAPEAGLSLGAHSCGPCGAGGRTGLGQVVRVRTSSRWAPSRGQMLQSRNLRTDTAKSG